MYLLPRGEQRALVGVTFLLFLSLLVRMGVHLLPGREPPGLEDFEREAHALMASLARADSLDQHRADSLGNVRPSIYLQGEYYATQKLKSVNSEPININRADSIQLLPLPGIGPVFAGRIIKYRKLLGGFITVDQLGEVYGMPEETLERIRSRVFIDSSAIRKIRIDSATFGELLRHPYLEYEQVKDLVEYRDFKGDIGSVAELRSNHILPDSIINKLNGYFDYR